MKVHDLYNFVVCCFLDNIYFCFCCRCVWTIFRSKGSKGRIEVKAPKTGSCAIQVVMLQETVGTVVDIYQPRSKKQSLDGALSTLV